MISTHSLRARRCSIATVLVIGLVTCRAGRLHAAPPEYPQARQLIQKGDRIAWYGSSSTRIGIWTKTVEFLLRTRHPELQLEFLRLGLPGGKFKDALVHLDGLLDKFRPTVVFFNFGVNDAAGGGEDLAQLKEHMSQCVAKVEARGARDLRHAPGCGHPQVGVGRGGEPDALRRDHAVARSTAGMDRHRRPSLA